MGESAEQMSGEQGSSGDLLVPTRLGVWLAIKEHRLVFECNERKSFLQLLAAGC